MARVPRIHSPLPLRPGAEVTLSEQAAAHVRRVLRLAAGAELVLFDGRGGEYRARLVQAERQAVRVEVLEQVAVERESPLRVTLGQGISRGERMDYVIQKAVELGVARIQPLVTSRCVVQLKGERRERRVEHWQGVATAACEQCGRNTIPPVLAPLELSQWLAGPPGGPAALLLDPGAARGIAEVPLAGEVRLLVGPEGGLSEAERDAAARAGFVGVRLGPRVLRTETAPLAALAAIQALWGDMR